MSARRHSLAGPEAAPPPADRPRTLGVVDMGATAIRLVIAEVAPGQPLRVLEEASRGVLLGKDSFTLGRLGMVTVEATLKAMEGFRRIMDAYGVERYRAVATSAVREASNRDAFLDRLRLRTGIEVEVIDGSEENRLTYIAVRERLRDHEAFVSGDALLVEVGGGSADISFLRGGSPIRSGTYALGAIRMRQNLVAWQGSPEQAQRLIRRHVQNVVGDIQEEMPLAEARHFIALGGDVRFAASRLRDRTLEAGETVALSREEFVTFCDQISTEEVERLVEAFGLSQWEAESLVPALLAYRELLLQTGAPELIVPDASLRLGLLLDLVRGEDQGVEDFSRQVLASAAALGEKYRYDAPHARKVAALATRLFDELKGEHGLGPRSRLLLEVAALLHDIGIFVNLRSHHKHSQYILSVSEVFGLSQDDMAVVAAVARYHRRALPQKSHLPLMSMDRETRVEVSKLAALLRVANALDPDHLQKVKDVRVVTEDGGWVIELEGTGDLTMERLAATARAEMMSEVFGRRVGLREERGRSLS